MYPYDNLAVTPSERISPATIFLVFLRLGCTSFGGPVAHLGYYRNEFVTRRKWLDEPLFAEIVAFCQMLPGPGSSQTGFTIGLVKGGWQGSIAAWLGFTTPSALLMVAFALSQKAMQGEMAQRAIHGLQLVAVAVIAQAVVGMRRTLAPDPVRVSIAAIAAILALTVRGPGTQLFAIAFGAVAGLIVYRSQEVGREPEPLALGVSRRAGIAAFALFSGLLLIPALVLTVWPLRAVAVFDAFYRTGALVFGGGHVVLPLLESATVARGWVDQKAFLAGYGAAQAIPGPLFTFSAFLGAALRAPPNGVPGAVLALVAIFLPGLLLVIAILPFWNRFRVRSTVRGMLPGINAAVVGILAAALYRPVAVGAVHSVADFVIALAGFLVLAVVRLPPWLVVAGTVAFSLIR
jgi:chromate transporter